MINFFLSFIMSLALGQSRLDPHGTGDMQLKKITPTTHSECLVCHTHQMNQWIPKKNTEQRCFDCHNPKGHSGLVEHMGMVQKFNMQRPFKKVTCIDCHRPHRAAQKKIQMKQYAASFLADTERKLPAGFTFKNSKNPMLKNNCRDCHSWKNLK